MNCKNCGFKNDDKNSYCSNCGKKLEFEVVSNLNNNNNLNNSDTGSFGWLVLGFFIPIAGLVLYITWRTTSPKNAKKAGLGALIKTIFSFLLFIFFFVVGIVFSIIDSPNSFKCDDDCYYNEISGECVCNDDHGDYGSIFDFDLDDFEFNHKNSNKEEIKGNDGNLYNQSVINWYNDINKENEKVITVFTLSYCHWCESFKPIIEEISKEYNIKLYTFDMDTINEKDKNVLLSTVDIEGYEGSSPYTFVVSNKEYLGSKVGYMSKDQTIEFLKSIDLIN